MTFLGKKVTLRHSCTWICTGIFAREYHIAWFLSCATGLSWTRHNWQNQQAVCNWVPDLRAEYKYCWRESSGLCSTQDSAGHTHKCYAQQWFSGASIISSLQEIVGKLQEQLVRSSSSLSRQKHWWSAQGGKRSGLLPPLLPSTKLAQAQRNYSWGWTLLSTAPLEQTLQ